MMRVPVPQLELSTCFVLRLAGYDPAIEFDGMTEQDAGLTVPRAACALYLKGAFQPM
jgi:hypothetical protein